MDIYPSTKVLPYVYLCREKNSPYFYIGYRYKNFVPSTEDFGTYYFSSNEYVKNNFNNFDFEIVAEFFTPNDALEFESTLTPSTASEYQLNNKRIEKLKGTTYRTGVQVDNSIKTCALPGCNTQYTNWRSKCCCPQHQKKYAGLRRHRVI